MITTNQTLVTTQAHPAGGKPRAPAAAGDGCSAT